MRTYVLLWHGRRVLVLKIHPSTAPRTLSAMPQMALCSSAFSFSLAMCLLLTPGGTAAEMSHIVRTCLRSALPPLALDPLMEQRRYRRVALRRDDLQLALVLPRDGEVQRGARLGFPIHMPLRSHGRPFVQLSIILQRAAKSYRPTVERPTYLRTPRATRRCPEHGQAKRGFGFVLKPFLLGSDGYLLTPRVRASPPGSAPCWWWGCAGLDVLPAARPP